MENHHFKLVKPTINGHFNSYIEIPIPLKSLVTIINPLIQSPLITIFPLFFPTSLCGVLVFDSVSRAPSPPPPALPPTHTTTTHTHTHNNNNTYTHTTTTHTHTQQQHIHTHNNTHTPHTHTTHTQTTHTHTTHTHPTHTYTHTHFRSAWQKVTSTVVLCGRRGTDGTGWRAWTGLGAAVTPVTPRHFCVAGVALGDIHLDFTWQAWHNLTSTVVLCGRRGTDGTGWRAWTGLGAAVTPVTPRHFCVAGMALGDIHLDFTWQAWHNLTSTVVLRGRRGTDGTGWRAWTGLGAAVTPVTPRHFCVAGVALGDIHLDFTWQAWHNLTSTVVLRGRRGRDGTGWRAWTGLGAAVTPVTPRHFCVAGVALGDIHLDFTWQAWHNLTSTVVLRGRRGTDGTGWRAWTGLGAAVTPVTPRHFCVAGVALGDIHLDFTWQAWHNLTSTVVLRGRRGTDGTGWRAWTGLGAAVTPVTPRHFCVAGVALGDIHLDFTWQAWHNLTSTVVLRGRRGTDGTGWRAWTGLGAAVTPVTPRHFCVAGVALGDIHLDFTWQAWHNLTSTVGVLYHTYTHTYIHTHIHTYLPFYLLDLSPPPLSFLPSPSLLIPLKLIFGRS